MVSHTQSLKHYLLSMTLNHSFGRSLFLAVALVFTFTFGASPVMANLFGKSELSGAWKERFQDVTKLKAYTDKGIKVDLSDSTIGNFDLTGAVFDGASFRDNEWKETTGKNITFSNTKFRNNTFNNIEFKESTFTNVTFEDSEFNRAIFVDSQLHNVKFIRCTFKYKTMIVGLKKNSTIDFDHSKFENGSLSESQASLSFHNSTLNNIEFTDLVLPSSLTFENSKLQDVDMSRSKLAKLSMDNVTGGGHSGFGGGSIAEVVVRNSEMGFSLNGGTLGKVSFVNSKLEGGFTNSNIKELQINNCKGMAGLGLYQAKIDTLQISNCPINNIQPLESIIKDFRINNASIVNSDFGDMKATNFTLTDVSLDQKIDFTGAHVEHLITKNITKQPELKLNLTNTNVKF
jgi:uncharacterized protein YjbI with pentapeptide repeats